MPVNVRRLSTCRFAALCRDFSPAARCVTTLPSRFYFLLVVPLHNNPALPSARLIVDYRRSIDIYTDNRCLLSREIEPRVSFGLTAIDPLSRNTTIISVPWDLLAMSSARLDTLKQSRDVGSANRAVKYWLTFESYCLTIESRELMYRCSRWAGYTWVIEKIGTRLFVLDTGVFFYYHLPLYYIILLSFMTRLSAK